MARKCWIPDGTHLFNWVCMYFRVLSTRYWKITVVANNGLDWNFNAVFRFLTHFVPSSTHTQTFCYRLSFIRFESRNSLSCPTEMREIACVNSVMPSWHDIFFSSRLEFRMEKAMQNVAPVSLLRPNTEASNSIQFKSILNDRLF